MFRDALRRMSLRKKLTILVSVGVVLPVLVLTYLQYRSLTELENKTKGAFKDSLRQRLTNVQLQMKQRLEDVADQTLKPIDNLQLSSAHGSYEFTKYAEDVKRSHPEIQQMFVSGYWDDQLDLPVRPNTSSLFERWQQTQSFLDDDRSFLFVHHACPNCGVTMRQGTYIIYSLKERPRTGPTGFAGILLSEGFVSDLMASSVKAAITSAEIVIAISDDNQSVLYSNGAPKNGYLLETNLDRPFSNLKARIGLKTTDFEEIGRGSFIHSAAATILVLLVLLGGVVLIIRATDREARLAQAKANFVANVSHELKTPLSLLSLFSEILELGRVNSDEKRLEYYGIMRHESRRLNNVIDNILDFSKIEAGRKTYNFVAGDMAEVIENVLSSYRYQIVNSGFDVETNLQRDLPPVSIDRDAMAQAISNLLDNAIKYSSEVKQLSITTDRRGSDLSVEITDRGIGIPRAEQTRIFEKFYRVGNGLVHDVKGSGLGLSLVKHIIEAHKGTISVESDVGKGSRFTILLPLAPKAADTRG